MAKDTDLAMNAMQQTNLTVSYILYTCTFVLLRVRSNYRQCVIPGHLGIHLVTK